MHREYDAAFDCYYMNATDVALEKRRKVALEAKVMQGHRGEEIASLMLKLKPSHECNAGLREITKNLEP